MERMLLLTGGVNVLESTAPVSAQLNMCEAKMHSGTHGRTRHASEGLSSPASAETHRDSTFYTYLLVTVCFNIAHHLPKKQIKHTHTAAPNKEEKEYERGRC